MAMRATISSPAPVAIINACGPSASIRRPAERKPTAMPQDMSASLVANTRP